MGSSQNFQGKYYMQQYMSKKKAGIFDRSLTTVDSISSIAKKTGTVEATFCIGTFSIWIAVVSH